MMQDRKYKFRMDAVQNRASGEIIPADEPVFVLRARDIHALDVLMMYYNTVASPEHQTAIAVRIKDFQDFKNNNPNKMKQPDTDLSKGDFL